MTSSPLKHAILLAAILAAATLAAPAGCGRVPSADGPADTFYLDFSLPPDAQKNGTVIFVVDGMNAEVFEKLLDEGKLPAFKKYFVDRGLYVRRAVASVPSVTIANLVSIATGTFPGHTDVTGVNWFDRNQLIWRDYATIAQKNTVDSDYVVPTIYEHFPERTTASLFFQPHRGATKFIEQRIAGAPLFAFGRYEFLDRLTLSNFDQVANTARARHEFPAATVVYQLSPDFHAYKFGAESPEYVDAIVHADRQIGRVLGDIERAGYLDRLHIAVVSDHGHRAVRQHFQMDAHIQREIGLRLDVSHEWDSVAFETRLTHYEELQAVSYYSGDRYYSLFLRKPKFNGAFDGLQNWLPRPTAEDLRQYPVVANPRHPDGPPTYIDLLDHFVNLPAVDTVAYSPAPGVVRLMRKGGEVELRQADRAAPIAYSVTHGQDPLGYAASGKVPADLLAGKPARLEEWFDATVDTGFPDLPVQILALFRSRHAGDIVMFAASDYDFGKRNRSGHGGIQPHDMFVPMLLAGPGVPHERRDHARSVDLMPTILQLMGKQPIVPIDGRSLIQSTRP